MPLENCQRCQGTGWKLVARSDGPGRFAVACDCVNGERATRTMDRARIPKRYEHCDFETYITDLADGQNYTRQQAESLQRMKMITQSFAREYPGSEQSGILLMGSSGAGKTHLAIAALKELLKRGHSGYFCEYGKLLRDIQNSYKSESETSEPKLLEPVLAAEVLVIDDLGCIKPSDWVRDMISYIINERYVAGSRDLSHPRCTIITTNYSDSANEKQAVEPSGRQVTTRNITLEDRIGNRLRSRLYEICRTVEVSAPDFRRGILHSTRARA